MKRYRAARRKFHALQLDFVFVAAVAAALFCHVAFWSAPQDGRLARGARRDAGGTSFSISFSGVPCDPLFEPAPRFRDARLPESTAQLAIPHDAALDPPGTTELRPLFSARLAAPALPVSVARPSFPRAKNPFLAPPPPVPEPSRREKTARKADVFVFRDAANPFPAVFVDSPGSSPEERAATGGTGGGPRHTHQGGKN